jgi:hypothetical protein
LIIFRCSFEIRTFFNAVANCADDGVSFIFPSSERIRGLWAYPPTSAIKKALHKYRLKSHPVKHFNVNIHPIDYPLSLPPGCVQVEFGACLDFYQGTFSSAV